MAYFRGFSRTNLNNAPRWRFRRSISVVGQYDKQWSKPRADLFYLNIFSYLLYTWKGVCIIILYVEHCRRGWFRVDGYVRCAYRVPASCTLQYIQVYKTTVLLAGGVLGGAVFGYSGHGARENRPTGSKTRRLIRSHLTVQRPFPGVRRPTPGYDFHVLRSHRRGNGRTSTAAPHEPPFTKTHKSHQFECTIFFGLVQVELLSNEN